MKKQEKTKDLLKDIRDLLFYQKKVWNMKDLCRFTGLSYSKISKLTSLKLIPMGNNKHIRQNFFDKEEIEKWLLSKPDLSDAYIEREFNKSLLKNKKA